MYSKTATRENDQSVYQWTLKSFLIGLFALLIGGRIHCLPSGKLVIIFKWQYFATTLLAVCFGTLAILNTSFQWSHMDPNDEQSTFVPITARKVSFKWRKYITNEPLAHPPHHPKSKFAMHAFFF
jgi:hypothetical protein